MAERPLFDVVARELEWRTDLDSLQARGTVRLALKQAGLDLASLTRQQMEVVLERVLPSELRSRGVVNPEPICAAIRHALDQVSVDGPGRDSPSPEDVFRRLSG